MTSLEYEFDTEERMDTGMYTWGSYQLSEDLGAGKAYCIYSGSDFVTKRALQEANREAVIRLLKKNHVKWVEVGGQHNTFHIMVKVRDAKGKKLWGYAVCQDIESMFDNAQWLDEELYDQISARVRLEQITEQVRWMTVDGFKTPEELAEWIDNNCRNIKGFDSTHFEEVLENSNWADDDEIKKLLICAGWFEDPEDYFHYIKSDDTVPHMKEG